MNFVSRSLLILLSFGPLIFSSLETLSHAVGNPTHQLKGILGGSVLFPANVSQGRTVEKIQWDFLPQRGGLGFWLTEFSHGKLEHQSPTDQFRQRLDMVDETTLRIKDLELDDSGIYNVRIWFTKTLFKEQCFSLTVYEPVPTPQIHHQVESKTPGGCNVTLRCHTAGRKDLSISWETGDPHRALGKSVNQYQVSDNGRELHISFWNSSLDPEFTCLVSNPVDRKRASFDLLNICQSDEGGQFGPSSWRPLLISALIVVSVIMVIMLMWMVVMRMRGKIRLERQSCDARERGEYPELRSHPEDGDEVDSDIEDFASSSRSPFPSLSSYVVSDTEPSEIEHCIPQTSMEDQEHLLEPLPRNSLRVPQGTDPLLFSQCCQLSRSYSLPSSLKHWPQKSCYQAKEQDTKTYPVIMEGVSLRAKSSRNAFITSTSQEHLRHSSSASLLMETAQERLDE
ncbi:SLAM family member 8-like isoform X1 [Podarcis lilfordi]|uniref:SLAM family member 8-like isoform X1 n=1 Tax=Podarcis lilfordi TaxID=74358 RepID=A0AA35LN71_9SAUR|nr:SLAM family member 8-like isoform X1 [Podarcis lilfordi]